MHIITECSRCGNDFMYHQLDTHLYREQKISNKKDGYSDTIVICQICDEIESIAEFIMETADHRGWENAESMAINKFGESKTSMALEWINKK